MEYMGDEMYWDNKFLLRQKKFHPEKKLMNNIKIFKKGTVLDIASGDGRNAIYLAQNNFKVTAIDFSIEALRKLERYAEEIKVLVTTQKVDLRNTEELKDMGQFDNIVINHYRLQKEILDKLYKSITKDGILFVNGFGEGHIPNDKIRENDLLHSRDFENLGIYFNLISHEEMKDDIGVFETYIFQRK